jgi:HlyD family secretion protein
MEPARPKVLEAEPGRAPPPATAVVPPRAKPRLGAPRWILLGALVLLLVALVALSLRPHRPAPLVVEIGAARRAAITRTVSAAGKLQAATTVKVSSNISGDILELAVKEGDRVRQGQLIARLEARRYAAQVKEQEALRSSATADLTGEKVLIERLRQDLGRVEKLVRGGNASKAEEDRALSDLRTEEAKAEGAGERIAQADASLADARHLLAFATVTSPIDGIVVTRHKQVGERVRGSDLSEDPIVTIATLSAMEAKVEVGEREVVFLHDGDRAEIEIDAFPDRKFSARVIEVAKNADVKNPGTEAEVTTFPVRLALTEQSPGALPGMSCEASIATERHEGSVVVPIQAVTVRTRREVEGHGVPAPVVPLSGGESGMHRDPLQKVLFVVEGGLGRLRPVETGLASEEEIEITSGLREGEQVVLGPYKVLTRELKDGRPVEQAKREPDRGGGSR